ncbi:MAG: Crp/Fnr family transcriptional regulator [Euzebya sp.]
MALEKACTPERIEAGTVLITAGSCPDAVHVIREGKVHLAIRTPALGRQTIGLVGPGGIIGDSLILTQQSAPYDAFADVDSTVLTITRDRFLSLLSESASLSLRWATAMAQRVEESHHRLVTLLTKDLAAQIATLLVDYRIQDNGVWMVQMPHQTIADLLGARRQSVSRVLGQMRRDGLVRSRYGSVEIVDLEATAALAGSGLDTSSLAESA